MTGQVHAHNNALNHSLSIHEIYAGADAKITIERLEMNLGHPSGAELKPGRVHALSTVRRRRPLYLLPHRPKAVLNRTTELESLRQTLSNFKTADLHGSDGVGKSTLMAALVHTLDMKHFDDGAVFITGRIPHQDLLQVLFESFYESDNPVKITPRHAPSYLYNLRALVILDDIGLGPKQVDPILDALGNAAVLIVGSERTAVGRGHAVPLRGLPRQEAIDLFAQALKRPLSPDERPLVEQICAMLNNVPLSISCVAAQIAQNNGSLSKLLADLRGRKSWAGPGGDLSIGPSLEQLVLDLDALDRQLLILAATFDGPTISSEALETLINLPTADFAQHFEHLQKVGLFYTEPEASSFERFRIALGPRGGVPSHLTVIPAYRQAVRTWLVDDAARLEIANYYVTRLARGDRLPGIELPSLIGALENCARNGWLEILKPLARAADSSLAGLGWWAGWRHVLDLTRRAAQAGGDRVLEAWAMHQLGSLLGALSIASDNRDVSGERALHLLRTAWNMRQALDDEIGASLSAHNLEVLEYLVPPPPPPKPIQPLGTPEHQVVEPMVQAQETAAPSGIRRAWRPRLLLTGFGLLVLLLVGALGLWRLTKDSGTRDETPELTVDWELGDAWNAYDNQTWTQQVKIVVEEGEGDYRYFANGEAVEELFQVTALLCDGARGTIRVEAIDGRTAQVEYEFTSPFCK